ncbi:hypothetical protein K523DRAFT_3132 [Schizophyllum commune Tattone D]|nr:hypothetical protein K523DRAFT_3132 [Schizophyllum commune Tattone D]
MTLHHSFATFVCLLVSRRGHRQGSCFLPMMHDALAGLFQGLDGRRPSSIDCLQCL